MTLTVEDGTGLANADSYVSAADASAYATANGLFWPTDVSLQEPALRRSTMWIDATYRGRFPGYRLNRRAQMLEWPRVEAAVRERGGEGPSSTYYPAGAFGFGYDRGDWLDYLPSNTVPVEIVRATIEAASREAQTPGILMGDVSAISAQQLKTQKEGDTSQTWFQGAVVPSTNSGRMLFPVIEALLVGILIQQSGYTRRAVRY